MSLSERMDRDADRARLLTRRAAFLGLAQIGMLAALGGRLYVLQVLEGETFKELAQENRVNLRWLAPSRGQIVDRNDVPLATNERRFRAELTVEQIGRAAVPALLARLRQIRPALNLDEERILKEAKEQRSFIAVTVADDLDWEQVAAIEVNAPDLPGLAIVVDEKRVYPLGERFAHVVGHVGRVSEADLAKYPEAAQILRLPGFRIGKQGIEKQHETHLRGEAGISHIIVNAIGRVMGEDEAKRIPGSPGSKVRLTLDARLQESAHERLAQEKSASAAVIDVHTGAVYALATAPGFDPETFSTSIPATLWQALLSDEKTPLVNKAVDGLYPPGSTFKMVTALAALEAGAISPDHTTFCPGYMDLGSHRFHCWKRGGHGTVGLKAAIAQSCDTFFYDIGRRVGFDAVAAMGRRLGLGVKLGLDLPQEKAGTMPDRAWKQARHNQPWVPGDTLNCSIGQGYVLTSPLQLAVMTARLVNGGRAVVPHLTLAVGHERRVYPPAPSIGLDADHLRRIFDGMAAVMTEGTARRSQIRRAGFEMGGKTGTAQVFRITPAQRARGINMSSLPWRLQHHALFVGFAPVHAPRYACAVVVEHGGGGSTAAAPVAHDLLLRTQELEPAGLGDQAGPLPQGAGRG